MAKPRIFLSSTYYDLKPYRRDLEVFIRSLGYEPILNERGNIPYGSKEKLEEYCYREIHNIDILISIIGGRFGSESSDENHSISNKELETARVLKKQVYIFIERDVYTEYNTYKLNKDKTINYKYVDDIRIYKFLEEIESFQFNNVTYSFENVDKIILILKEQWAGLFQRLLFEESEREEMIIIKNINNTANTLNELVQFVAKDKASTDDNVKNILFRNHPAFNELRRFLKLNFPVIFNNYYELESFLRQLGYRRRRSVDNSIYIFYNGNYDDNSRLSRSTIRINKNIFDDNNLLKFYTNENWIPGSISFSESTIITDEPSNVADL